MIINASRKNEKKNYLETFKKTSNTQIKDETFQNFLENREWCRKDDNTVKTINPLKEKP